MTRSSPLSRIADLADRLGRAAEAVPARAGRALFEPVVNLGVTGLSRSGKTVLITSLVANLLKPGRMTQLRAAADGRLLMAYLQPQPDPGVARFPFEDHLATLAAGRWPEGTRRISQLRLSLKVRPTGFLTGATGPRIVHLDITDYPGEWLADLSLMDTGYAQWSEAVLAEARTPGRAELAADWLAEVSATDPAAALDEARARALAAAYTGYLRRAAAAGFARLTPGRFLLPGEMEGSPALTFAPLPGAGTPPRGSLAATFAERFEAYRRLVVRPFFRDHFARLDRQVVLVDALGAVAGGPRAVADLSAALETALAAFRPGAGSWLARLLGARRVERIAFAAAKADHLHHTQHPALARITEALVAEARGRADFRGARTASFAIAGLRATAEQTLRHEGHDLPCVRGRLAPDGREAALYAGRLPEDPAALTAPARSGAEAWLDAEYARMDFLPPAWGPEAGPPHIRLDRMLEFLIGDRLL